jgi:hypothetical protein
MPAWKGIIGQGFTAAQFPDYVASTQFGVWRPQFVVLHNTFIPRLSQWHSVPGLQRMKALEHFYRDIQGWSAGPHLFVADDLIWAFTPLNTPGVHSPSWNAISWGVELVGDYSVEQLVPTLQENAVSALATLHASIGLDPDGLRLHKEDPKTTHKGCPGSNIVKADVIQWIVDRLAATHAGDHVPAAISDTGTTGTDAAANAANAPTK